jgi:hypothetical protein
VDCERFKFLTLFTLFFCANSTLLTSTLIFL